MQPLHGGFQSSSFAPTGRLGACNAQDRCLLLRANLQNKCQVVTRGVGAPSCVVHVLPQQLNGWLSSILLHLRHVEVINQYDLLLAYGWSIHAFSPLFQLAINDVLRTQPYHDSHTQLRIFMILQLSPTVKSSTKQQSLTLQGGSPMCALLRVMLTIPTSQNRRQHSSTGAAGWHSTKSCYSSNQLRPQHCQSAA